jgi:multisubunit Na+/H+ antiporter MnhC subunit
MTLAAYLMASTGLIRVIVASLILLMGLVLVCILPGYVRQRAERYGESFSAP